MDNPDPKPMIVDDRYELRNPIGSGAMGSVYVAYDRMTGDTVALKIVKWQDSDSALFEELEQANERLRLTLTNEFRLLAGMRHPRIISVLDYGFTEDETPYYTMEYLSNAQTIVDAAQGLETQSKVTLLIQALQALEYLHRRNVLHRDLKPENILVVDGNVKVLDFGISIFKSQVAESETAGTLAYMSPETLNDQTNVDEVSDLWAIGIIAFEMLHAYPFERSNVGLLIQQIIAEQPDFDLLNVNDRLRLVIERMMVKEKEDRYANSQAIINALMPFSDESIMPETEEIREAYLQTAPFVGREQEMDAISAMLVDAQNGKGQVHLISGVSGIGKSRLIDELRVKALVKGMLVLRGQAHQEADQPYVMWHSIIRRICSMVELNDTEAAILKPLISDIEELLSRPIPDAPYLHNENAKQKMESEQLRLFDFVEQIMRRIPRPILLLMEDLHWADSGSIDLLVYLSPFLKQQSIVVLGSYRSDEAPDLPEKFEHATVTHLSRLGNEVIRELSTSMLGSAGERPGVIDILNRESEGNVFFLVETIRELAQHSGQLGQIGLDEFPEKIFPHGISDIVQRRLNKVDAKYISNLRLAAVAGRELDVGLLKTLNTEIMQDDWLTICSNYAILEVIDGSWRFTHSKLRDGILDDIEAEEIQTLHKQTAEAKITHYKGGEGHEAAIAQHWEKAQELEKAGDWYFKAAQIARKAYATATSVEYYEKASQYIPDTEESRPKQLQIYDGLGQLYLWQSQIDRAETVVKKMKTLAETQNDEVALAKALIRLCDISRDAVQYEQVVEYAKQVEELCKNSTQDMSSIKVDALAHHAFGLNRMRQYEAALPVAKSALELAEKQGFRSDTVRIHSVIGILSFRLGDIEAAEQSLKLSLSIAEELGDRRDIAVRSNNLGELYRYLENWDLAKTYLNTAYDIYEDIGAEDGWIITTSNLAGIDNKLGKYTDTEAKIRKIFAKIPDPKKNQIYLEAVAHLVEALFHQMKYTEALEFTQEWLNEATAKEQNYNMGLAWHFAAQIAWKSGIPFINYDKDYTVVECFEAARDNFVEYETEQAHVLRDWALFEFNLGNVDSAQKVKDQAMPLLIKLNLDADIDDLNDTIPSI